MAEEYDLIAEDALDRLDRVHDAISKSGEALEEIIRDFEVIDCFEDQRKRLAELKEKNLNEQHLIIAVEVENDFDASVAMGH